MRSISRLERSPFPTHLDAADNRLVALPAVRLHLGAGARRLWGWLAALVAFVVGWLRWALWLGGAPRAYRQIPSGRRRAMSRTRTAGQDGGGFCHEWQID